MDDDRRQAGRDRSPSAGRDHRQPEGERQERAERHEPVQRPLAPRTRQSALQRPAPSRDEAGDEWDREQRELGGLGFAELAPPGDVAEDTGADQPAQREGEQEREVAEVELEERRRGSSRGRGNDLRAQGLLLEPWRAHPDGTGRFGSGSWFSADKQGNYSLEVIVSEDEGAKSVIARQVRQKSDPIFVPLPGISRFYVTFRQAAGDLSLFAGGGMKVFLHYAGENWPVLKEVDNELSYFEPGGDTGTRRLGISLH